MSKWLQNVIEWLGADESAARPATGSTLDEIAHMVYDGDVYLVRVLAERGPGAGRWPRDPAERDELWPFIR